MPALLVALSSFFLVACAAGRAIETDRIIEALALVPGMKVADVGAGEGEWTEMLAESVGANGSVFATEVDDDLVEKIRQRFVRAGLGNVTAVLGDQEKTGLPADCCDAILLRMVYHHFTRPGMMRKDLRRALRPDGRLVVIDIRPQTSWRELPGVPDRGGHGLTAEDLLLEMEKEGFEAVERFDNWNGDEDRFCVVFRLSGQGAS